MKMGENLVTGVMNDTIENVLNEMMMDRPK